MDRKEINQMDMIEEVMKFLDVNVSFYGDKMPIINVVNAVNQNIADIKAFNQDQSVKTKADTEIKNQSRTEIANLALKIAAGISAIAATNKDTRLKLLANVSPSGLMDMRNSDFIIKARSIHDATIPLVTDLADWGVQSTDIDKLDTLLIDYVSKSPNARNVKVQTKQANSDMKAKIDETAALLRDQLDLMMLPFKNLQPSFYTGYLNARIIIDRTGTHASPVVKKEEPKTTTV
jgi:hypothetical protein